MLDNNTKRMGIESNGSPGLARETRRIHHERVITAAYPRAQEFLAAHSIDPQNFTPPYDKEMVGRDIAYAERKTTEFAASADTPEKQFLNKSAVVAEAMSLDGIRNGWFVNNKKPEVIVRASHTARYDDIANGIDVIVEFVIPESANTIGLAIDVTFGNRNTVEKKMREEEERIRKGELSELKYFETKNVPRVIIGIDLGHVVTLAEKWSESREMIGGDPMQIIILREIAKQCEHFVEVARSEAKRLRDAPESGEAQKDRVEQLRKIAAIYEKNQNMFLEIARSKPMEMRALVTDKYPDRVGDSITTLTA